MPSSWQKFLQKTSGEGMIADVPQMVKGHYFEDSEVHILDREGNRFSRGMKQAMYFILEQPSINRGMGLSSVTHIYSSFTLAFW